MTDSQRRAVRLIIQGRVQGVWFRGWTVDMATSLGLDGWVRNRRDGSVEALAAGPPEAVEQLIQACHTGPSMAHVLDVDVRDAADPGRTGFHQETTA
ncbi:MAG: acylphosphatase [Rhodospirillaceae bacterium]|nr:acylphosphatase [Rhodospirillaceae bacterium]